MGPYRGGAVGGIRTQGWDVGGYTGSRRACRRVCFENCIDTGRVMTLVSYTACIAHTVRR